MPVGLTHLAKPDQTSMETDKDRGWAWVICAALFVITFMALGYVRIFGILFVAFQTEFSSTASVTALIMGIYAIIYSLTSLLVCNILLERFSVRVIIVVGGLVFASGVALDVFAFSIEFLMVTNGIVVGIAGALIFPPGAVIIGRYFEKRRSFAYSLIFCGPSLGGIILPPFLRYLLDSYGVRGAMLIYGALLLHVIPMALLLVPPKKKSVSLVLLEEPLDKSKSDNGVIISSWNSEKYTDMNRLSRSLFDLPVVIRDKENNSYKNTESLPTSFQPNTELSASLPVQLNQKNPPSLPPQSNYDDNNSPEKCNKDKSSFFSRLCSSLDVTLFHNVQFLLFLGFHLFGYAGIVTFSAFVPPVARDNQLSDDQGALLISIFAGLDLFCRICTGILADTGWFHRYRMLAFAYFILGTVYQFVRFLSNFVSMVIYVVVFGLFSGSFYSLHPSIAVDFFGTERFPKVFGYVQFAHGIVNTASYPLIGQLRDLTGNYILPCHFLGASLYIAAVLLLLRPCALKCKQ